MPRKPSGDFDPKSYLNQYIKSKIKYKHVHFSVDKPEDMELLKWVEGQDEPVANYFKRLAREDMERKKSQKLQN